MKKLILLVALVFVGSAFGQESKMKKVKKMKKMHHEMMMDMTPAEKAEIQLKKMTLRLDLTEAQQNKIRPMLVSQAKKRQAMREKRKSLMEKNEKPSKEERKAKIMERLDEKIVFKREIKNILNEKQYEKFEKIMMHKAHNGKKKKKKIVKKLVKDQG